METNSDTDFKPAVKRGKRGFIIGITAAVAAMIAIAAVLLLVLNAPPVNENTISAATAPINGDKAPAYTPPENGSAVSADGNAGLVLGNLPKNIRNAGIAAENNGWIYYSNSADGHSLYKIRTDGTEKMKLNSENSTSINVAGDWVYYRNQYSISRVSTDGRSRETIYEGENVTRLNVYGDWIYFIVLTDKVGQMYRMRLNGTELTEYDESLVRDAFKEVVDGWSFANSKDGLCKVRSDGTGWEILTDDNANCVNAAEGWVYYSNVNDNGSLYKIRTDGTEKTKLNDDRSGNINIAGGWIYYINIDEKGAIYRMKTDGSENQPVE